MAAAQRTIGIFASSIGNRAAGNGKTAGGYIWPSGPPYKGLKPAAMVPRREGLIIIEINLTRSFVF